MPYIIGRRRWAEAFKVLTVAHRVPTRIEGVEKYAFELSPSRVMVTRSPALVEETKGKEYWGNKDEEQPPPISTGCFLGNP